MVYTLVFMSLFLTWSNTFIIKQINQKLKLKYQEEINKRLDIEMIIYQKYINEEVETYDFTLESIEINSYKKDTIITVIISNSSIPSFQYVIMEDESVIYSIMED